MKTTVQESDDGLAVHKNQVHDSNKARITAARGDHGKDFAVINCSEEDRTIDISEIIHDENSVKALRNSGIQNKYHFRRLLTWDINPINALLLKAGLTPFQIGEVVQCLFSKSIVY